MDQILHANKSSVILRSLPSKAQQDLSYATEASFPILAKQIKSIASDNTLSSNFHGSDLSFKIPKNYYLCNAMIRTTFAVGTTGCEVGSRIGLNFYEYIELRSNNTVLSRISDHYINGRAREDPINKSIAVMERANVLVPTTEVIAASAVTTSRVTYTPIYSSFFENYRNHLDLSFLEQLQIVARVNTAARGGFPNNLTACSAELICWFYDLDAKAKEVLTQQNFSPSRPLSMFSYSTYTERQVCTGTTSNTFRLTSNFPVTRMYICLKDNTSAGQGDFALIHSLTFSVQGTDLLQSLPRRVLQYETDLKSGTSVQASTDLTLERDESPYVVLQFSMDPSRLYNSGALSLSTINYATLTINHETITAANFDICVVSEYLQIITADPSNGTLVVSQNQ